MPKTQIEKLKEALRNKEYKKMLPIETAKHRAEFDKVRSKVIKGWEENTGKGGLCIMKMLFQKKQVK